MPAPTTPEMRQAYRLRSRGTPVDTIAAKFDKSPTTIYRWLGAFPDLSPEPEAPEEPEPEYLTHEQKYQKAFDFGRRLAQSNATFRTICALYWGEGSIGSDRNDPSKTEVSLASSDTDMIRVWCAWLSKQEIEYEVHIRVHLDKNNTIPDQSAAHHWKKVVRAYFPQIRIRIDRVGEVRETHHKSYGTAYIIIYDSRLRGMLMGGIDLIATRT